VNNVVVGERTRSTRAYEPQGDGALVAEILGAAAQ
jgi:hypothetical protein